MRTSRVKHGVKHGLGTVLAVLLLTVTPAFAGVGGAVFPLYPPTVAVGDTNVAVDITIVNASTPPNDTENIMVFNIFHTPSCASTQVPCPAPAVDPGVFQLLGPGTGRAGTACADITFTAGAPDPGTGEQEFFPNAAVILGPSNVGGPAATCVIDFLVDVLTLPNKDASAQAGIQTDALARADFVGASSGNAGGGVGSSQVTSLTLAVYTDLSHFAQAAGPLTSVNFDQDPCGGTIAVPSGGRLASNIYSAVGVTFAAGVIFPDPSFATSPPNIITNTQINTPTPALVDATFAGPVHAVGIANVGAGAVLRVFDVNNQLIVSANTDTDPATFDFIGITSLTPIHRFEFDFVSGLGFGGDNLVFTTIQIPDCMAPVLTVPGTLTVDATSPAGAAVTYSVTATDNVDPNPAVSCAQPSGSTFPIGTTTVMCTATDASGNSSNASFQVVVQSAANQTMDLMGMVSGLDQEVATSLTAKLQSTLNAVNGGNLHSACGSLGAFMYEVRAQSGKRLTVAQAGQLMVRADRIEAALGCP